MLVGPTFNPEEQPNLAQQDWLLRKQQNVRCNSSGWLAGTRCRRQQVEEAMTRVIVIYIFVSAQRKLCELRSNANILIRTP